MILVLFPNVTSEKMALTSWKLAKPLLQRTILGVLFFGGYESARQKLLNYTNQRDNKGKLSYYLVLSVATTRLIHSIDPLECPLNKYQNKYGK